MLLFAYIVGLIAYNYTEINMAGDVIRTSRGPLPNPLRRPQTIPLHDVESISYEETSASIENEYDLPRFHVWAVTVNGGRKRIATDLVEEYAVYISQRLNQHLHTESDPNMAHLQDQPEIVQRDDQYSPET
jgi:hypothetical protein